MFTRTRLLFLCAFVLVVCKGAALAQFSNKQLRPSDDCWDHPAGPEFSLRVRRISPNRRLAVICDTIYMLNARSRVLWRWSSKGPPLIDFPIIDSSGTIYAIGYDLIWVALESASGKEEWRMNGNGRAGYSQIGLYKGDLYFVVTDMEGYRDNLSDIRLKIRDRLSICLGNRVLWHTEIPAKSRIRIERNKMFVILRRNGREVRMLVRVPQAVQSTH